MCLWAGITASCLAQDFNLEIERLQGMFQAGRYQEAETFARQLLARAEQSHGRQSDAYAVCLGNLATVHSGLGRHAEAAAALEQAVAIRQQVRGLDDLPGANLLNSLASALKDLRRFPEAERHYRQALQVQQRLLAADDPTIAATLHNLGLTYADQARWAEAEPLYQQSLAIKRRRLPADHPDLATSLDNLGSLYKAQGRYTEAEAAQRQGLAIREKALGSEHPDVSFSLNNLAVTLMTQGRFAEAEPLYKRCLAIKQLVFGAEHPQVAITLNNLAILYCDQGRFTDAEKRYRRALAIHEASHGQDHPQTASALHNLAVLYKRQRRFDDAEPLEKRALAIFEGAGQEQSNVAACLMTLASLHVNRNRPDEAEPLFRRVLAMLEGSLGADHPDLANVCFNLADVYQRQGRAAEAEPLADRAVALCQQWGASPEARFHAYELRSRVRQQQGRADAARDDLARALDEAEKQRLEASGDETDRAELFASFLEAFERMVLRQCEAGDLDAALATAERARARSLMDQMQGRGMNPWAGVASQQAASLRQRQASNQSRIAEAENRLKVLRGERGLSREELRQQSAPTLAELSRAQEEAVQIFRELRTLSPACRLTAGEGYRPLSLADLQAWVDAQKGLLWYYVLGQEGGLLFSIAAGEKPRWFRLTLDPQTAAQLGIDNSGPVGRQLPEALRAEVLETMLLLAHSQKSSLAVKRLARLWQVLVPPDERQRALGGKFQRLIVVPDGVLTLLPFESLVVSEGSSPRYLLDDGPPLLYGPSLTALWTLARRPAPGRVDRPVLTVGDPAYPTAGSSARSDGQAPGEPSVAARYLGLAGRLGRLPYSGNESAWVAEVFRNSGMASDALLEEAATEAAIRARLAGRRVVHLACHGLADQGHGSLFAALAFAPGPDGSRNPADDGFLSLAEIYDLDLAGCELAVLSACQTNFGPQQRGEGVWAISRGFLVAGARRVVASDWLVDDEAAASLVSYFCSLVARGSKEPAPFDHARALQAAKRWVRQQEKWQAPYYWATFVLLGPP